MLNEPWALKSFWAPPMVLLGVVSHVEAQFGPFGGSVSLGARSAQLRCTICAERTKSSEIILRATDGTPT